MIRMLKTILMAGCIALMGCSTFGKVPLARASLSLPLPRSGFLSINIYDSDKKLVRGLTKKKFVSKGVQLEKWDGSNDQGNPLPVGKYSWEANLEELSLQDEAPILRGGSLMGQVYSPMGLAAIDSGSKLRLFVTDQGNHRIQEIGKDGAFVREFGQFGLGGQALNNPSGLVATSGEIYVSDTDNHRIQKFSDDGDFLSTLGSSGTDAGQFQYPNGLAIDPYGNLVVADTFNDRIQVIDRFGNSILSIGGFGQVAGFFDRPEGVCADDDGNYYVADTKNNRIQKFARDGYWKGQFGSIGSGPANLNSPGQICIRDGLLYVSDKGNHRVQIWTGDGQEVAASDEAAGLGTPQGIVCAGTQLFVADSDNQDIKVFQIVFSGEKTSGEVDLANP